MKIEINPLLQKKPKFAVEQHKFREMLREKRVVQRYDKDGQKHFKIKDNEVRYRKGTPLVLKHDRMEGSFAILVYKTGSELNSAANYIYQGMILVEEGEIARVYRDSLLDGYTLAYFTDDTTLLMEVRNKESGERFGIQIDGEPTLAACTIDGVPSCFDFSSGNDDAAGTNQKMIEEKVKLIKDELSVKDVYAVIQLDC